MLMHPFQWVSEIFNLLLMDKSNHPQLTFVLLTRLFLIGFIIVPVAAMVFDIHQRATRIAHWNIASVGVIAFNALRIILLGSGFWILALWAFCYIISIPPPWMTLNEYAKQFIWN
jgi:hypothetical protein